MFFLYSLAQVFLRDKTVDAAVIAISLMMLITYITFTLEPPLDTLEKPLKVKPTWFLVGVSMIGVLMTAYVSAWVLEIPFTLLHRYQSMDTYTILSIILLAPVCEELIFREVLYKEMTKHVSKLVVFVFVTAIFIAIHYPKNGLQVGQYLANTAILFWTYEYSGQNVLVSTIVHMLINIIAIA